MKIIDYLELIFKNKIVFAVITFASAVFLTSLYYVFKDQIKYLNTSPKVTQEYIILDNLNKNLFHDLLIDAEDLVNYQLEIQDTVKVDKFISYESFSKKLMDDLLLLLNDHDVNNFKMDIQSKPKSNTIQLYISFFYDTKKSSTLDNKQEVLKLYFIDIQNKHNQIVQERLNRYFDKLKFFINTKTNSSFIYNTYVSYLKNLGIEDFIEDIDNFKLSENLNTLIIKKTYDNTSSFPKPSIYFIFLLSLIIGIIIAFSYISFRKQRNNHYKKD